MNTIIAGVILFIVVIGFLRNKYNDFPIEIHVALTAVASILLVIGTMLVLKGYVPHRVVSTEYELAAMRTTDGIEGSFVLGSGSVGSFMRYHVYIKNSDGSVSPNTISVYENVRIKEDQDLKNVGYWTRTVWKYDYSTFIAHWVVQLPDAETLISNELKVPAGTVVHSFAAQ